MPTPNVSPKKIVPPPDPDFHVDGDAGRISFHASSASLSARDAQFIACVIQCLVSPDTRKTADYIRAGRLTLRYCKDGSVSVEPNFQPS